MPIGYCVRRLIKNFLENITWPFCAIMGMTFKWNHFLKKAVHDQKNDFSFSFAILRAL